MQILHGSVKADGKVYPSGTPFQKLPKKVKDAAKAAGMVVVVAEVSAPSKASDEEE